MSSISGFGGNVALGGNSSLRDRRATQRAKWKEAVDLSQENLRSLQGEGKAEERKLFLGSFDAAARSSITGSKTQVRAFCGKMLARESSNETDEKDKEYVEIISHLCLRLIVLIAEQRNVNKSRISKEETTKSLELASRRKVVIQVLDCREVVIQVFDRLLGPKALLVQVLREEVPLENITISPDRFELSIQEQLSDSDEDVNITFLRQQLYAGGELKVWSSFLDE